jgi:phage terminase large subunit-like protein
MSTWQAWRAFLCALFGLPMTEDKASIYNSATGRTEAPQKPFNEAWLVVGRRGGKSFILALIAVYLACFKDWLPYLTRGERGTVMVIAADRKQARTILRYVKALLFEVPMLARLVAREIAEGVDLTN